MRRRHSIVYPLLLLIPSLALGIGGFVLLRHETARWEQRQARAAEAHARLVAERVAVYVSQLETEVSRCLRPILEGGAVPANAAGSRLEACLALAAAIDRSGLPLVRQVFLWRPPNVLVYPDPVHPATSEQERFVRRYALLISGQAKWAAPAADPAASLPAPQSGYPAIRWRSNGSSTDAGRESLPYNLAETDSVRLAWVPWYADNQLHLLGWQQVPGTEAIVGIELEMMALQARLLPLLSEIRTLPDTGFALVDGSGHLLFRSAEPAGNANAVGTAPIGPLLPHWRIEVYPAGLAPATSPWLAMGSFLLLGLLVVAILTGGGMILLQGRRDRLAAEQKTSFVSNVSHELKTPLTTIRMYAEMLAEERVREDKRPRYLQVIVDESQRLTRLVNNVLDFSRLEQGRKSYRPERLDLGSLVRQVVETLHPRLEAAGMELHLALGETPAEVVTDRDALEQVLLNLVDNAVKYAAAGKRLDIELKRESSGVTLAVNDAGPGIPRDHWGRVFEAFHRVDDSLTAAVGGTGLGLSISRRLLRDQGGELTYEPVPAGGARFVIRLPATGGNVNG